MRHSFATKRHRGRWAVAATCLVAIGVVAAAQLLDLEGDETSVAATPAPRVTVTASPAEPQLLAAEPTVPITASAVPNAAVVEPPNVKVSPNLSQFSIDDPASPWVVINKARPVTPQDWEPAELRTVGGAQLVPQAATALGTMADAAAAANAPFKSGSGYRAYGFQQSLYADYVGRWGEARADRFSARPGHSEHQTGWAVDVYASESCRLQECFADEAAGQWIVEHAHEFGFIVRYPAGAESVTGYAHEPWHLRYVGVDLATHMFNEGVETLEDVFGLDAAPDYS